MRMVANMKNNWSIIPLLYKIYNKKVPLDMNTNQFSLWFSGFIDGEGNFQVFLDRQYLRAIFRIRLHIDDIAILFKIKKFLGVGKVSIHGSICLYSITNTRDIKNVLLPLLDNYKLYTSKWLDYIDFKLVINYLSSSNTTKVSNEKLEWANSIINNMNSTRINYNFSLIPNLQVNPYWLLGFIEGEGTFGFKNLTPYFQIGQHTKNLKVLQSIALYLQSIPQVFTFSKNSAPLILSNALHSNNKISVISINNIDSLYDYLMFLFLDMPFQTRKGVDFYLWGIALHFHKLGYFYLKEGFKLVSEIAKYTNNGRYSTNLTKVSAPSLENINKVLELTLPVTLTPEMRHAKLAQALYFPLPFDLYPFVWKQEFKDKNKPSD
uniref:LAGLIDADG homing endonuclease n=1 Tax=Cyclocybe aegerita TaxID=1973307 RepID=Q32X64_CYCAE|nr:LAGLIDADG homing endonuclease [Cyclocybe aegerita]